MTSHSSFLPVLKKARQVCLKDQGDLDLAEAFCEIVVHDAKYDLCCIVSCDRSEGIRVLKYGNKLAQVQTADLERKLEQAVTAIQEDSGSQQLSFRFDEGKAHLPQAIHALQSIGLSSLFTFPIADPTIKEKLLLIGTCQPDRTDAIDLDGLAFLSELLAFGFIKGTVHQESSFSKSRMQALREMTEAIIIPVEVQSLLHSVVQKATELLNASSGGMYLCEPDKNQVRCIVSYQTPQDYTGITMSYGEGASGLVAQSGEPIIVQDYGAWENRAAIFEEQESFHAVMSAPMAWKDEILGVIHVLREESDPPFTQLDLELLSLFGNEAAIALKSAQIIEVTQEKLRQTSLIGEITQAALQVAESEDMLQVVAERISELAHAETCMIALWDERRDSTVSLATYTGNGSQDWGILKPEPGESNLVRSSLDLDRTIVVEDVAATPHSSERIKALAAKKNLQSLLALPLSFADDRLGGLVIGYCEKKTFSKAEIELCEQMSKQVAFALATVKGYALERRRREELERLHDASLRLTSILQPEPVLEAILAHTLKIVEAKDAHFFFYDGERLEFAAAEWAGQRQEKPFAEPRENGITYSVARGGKTIVVPNAGDHPIFKDMPWEGAIIGIPLRTGEKVIGVMNVAYDTPHVFYDDELLVLQLFADQAAIALYNANLYSEAVAEQSHLQLLYDIGRELTASLNPSEVLQKAADITAQHLEGIYCEIFLLDPESERLHLKAAAGFEAAQLPDLDDQLDLRIGKGFTGRVADNLEAVIVDDFKQEHQDLVVLGSNMKIQSGMGAPILTEQKLLGVINVFHSQKAAFDIHRLDLLSAISRQISLALTNAERYKQIERQLIRLSTLQQVSQVVSRRFDLETLIEETVQQVKTVLGYPLVEIFLVEGDDLVQGPIMGHEREKFLRIPLEQGILGRVARTNQAVLVPDVSQDPDYIPVGVKSVAEIAVPLHKGGVVIGVLNVESAERKGLSEEDLRMLSMVADQVSVAIENAALYDRLRNTMDELEETVQERTSELQAALEQARQADQAKTAFVSDVSHELRTPLSNIRLYLDLLIHGKQERFQDYLATLNRETDRLAGLIEDLLAISRLDAGSAGTNFETMDINSLARGLVLDRERLCAERKLKLNLSAEPSIPKVQADVHMISQAIASMLTNAMNYTRAGGTINIATGLREMDGEEWVILEVKDTGVGIPEKEQPMIFERFYRGSASKEMAAPGTGLGLAIAKEILEKHRGKITFESKLDRGSTFTLWLPTRAPET